MKILIAGGAGFVGKNLSSYLLTKYPKWDLVVVDDLSTSSFEQLSDFTERKNYKLVEMSITDRKATHAVVKQYQPDVIISAVNTYEHEKAINTFVLGNTNLLEAVRKSVPSLTSFILLSDDDVYGETASDSGNIRDARETDALVPQSPLAAAQTSADILALSYYVAFQIPTVVLRSSNVYGPMQSENRLLVRLINHALENESIPIYGDGSHTRDWLYIDDFIELIDSVINYKGDKSILGQAFNVSSETPYTVLQATELILTMLNKPKEYITFDDTVRPNTLRKALDASKVKATFDWIPSTDFKDGLKKTLDWYSSHM